jgi:hypothetical protein
MDCSMMVNSDNVSSCSRPLKLVSLVRPTYQTPSQSPCSCAFSRRESATDPCYRLCCREAEPRYLGAGVAHITWLMPIAAGQREGDPDAGRVSLIQRMLLHVANAVPVYNDKCSEL